MSTTGFTASELADLGRIAAVLRVDVGEVRRLTNVPDGEGGWIEDWATLATVTMRMSPVSAGTTEMAIAGRLGINRPAVAHLPPDADVLEKDRLVVFGRTYEIAGVEAMRSFQQAGSQVVLVDEQVELEQAPLVQQAPPPAPPPPGEV